MRRAAGFLCEMSRERASRLEPCNFLPQEGALLSFPAAPRSLSDYEGACRFSQVSELINAASRRPRPCPH